MKIDRGRLKKSSSEVPLECQALIDKLRSCTKKELFYALNSIETWTFGKCELYHWIDVLDICDDILEESARPESPRSWVLRIDLPEMDWERQLLLRVLSFTTLLIEHSFSRHLYNSVEHLISLLTSCNMSIVLGVLNLLYMFSKRSNFITRLSAERKQALLLRLTHLAESWIAYEDGFTLVQSCKNANFIGHSTVHYDFFDPSKSQPKNQQKYVIHIEGIEHMGLSPAQLMDDILKRHPGIPEDKQILLFCRMRLYINFSNYETRLLCVQARLQATSVLAYSNAIVDNAHILLYNGFLEELVDVVQLADPNLIDIRAAALRTLTSIIHLDRNPHFPKKPGSRLNMIIEVTTANSFHGFLPAFVRSCINTLLSDPHLNHPDCPFPLPLATALFSFLYHLASYEAGGEALVSSGIMESLIRVIHWHGKELEHITFVTRAVRVIDLITNIEMQSFQAHGGLASFISRLEVEVNVCRKEQPFVIQTTSLQDCYQAQHNAQVCRTVTSVELKPSACGSGENTAMDLEVSTSQDFKESQRSNRTCESRSGKTCLPQRAALLKSMLNFLKKAIQDASFSDSVRLVMAGSLPSTLRHIISNAEYYGASLFLLATDVVTVYVFQEPSFLSTLQDDGLTYVIMNALLVKDVPATREVLGSLPNIFSALCLNARGLDAFIQYEPFMRLFKLLLSPMYLNAMKRRRSSDAASDTACNLGNAMDELIRHQPSLKAPAIAAVIKLLDDLYEIHQDPKNSSFRGNTRPEASPTSSFRQNGNSSSDEEEEDDASTLSHPQQEDGLVGERLNVPLVDYIISVMKFVDSILTNNSTDDHCREFISQGGLPRLMRILEISYLPLDHPNMAAGQAVATVCKSILVSNLTNEGELFKVGLKNLKGVLDNLRSLHVNCINPNSSILLHELASQPNFETAFHSVYSLPLLHGVNSVHGYIVMFLHLSRSNQNEIRTASLSHWATDMGLAVLSQLKNLYKALVWESTVLLALCNDEVPFDADFAKEDLEKLIPVDKAGIERLCGNDGGMTSAMEALSTDDMDGAVENTVQKKLRLIPSQIVNKLIKPLLHASSRLGRALAELFGLLVKVCVGTPPKNRRQRFPVPARAVTPASRDVSEILATLLIEGLKWNTLPEGCMTKFKLTYLICSIGFTSPLLFDEKKNPYYLMLHQFIIYGGKEVYFETFRWALSGGNQFDPKLGLEHPDLPEGTGEFLDAWLLLLEKMVNPKGILESPYAFVNKGQMRHEFDPARFLFNIQKSALEAVMMMWKKKPLPTYGTRMSETMFAILRHIIRGEKIFYDMVSEYNGPVPPKLSAANRSAPSASSTTPTPTTSRQTEGDSSDVNPEHLQQLMDMGFSQERCVVALMNTSNVEQATDYLLNHPPPLAHAGQALDYYIPDDDQLFHAIALSLGGKPPSDSEPDDQSPYKKYEYHLVSRKDLDDFTVDVFDACLFYIDSIPDTTYYAMDLLTVATRRNGAHFRDKIIRDLVFQVENYGEKVFDECFANHGEPSKLLSVFLESESGEILAARMHLLSLLLEELKMPCALTIVKRKTVSKLVGLLELAEIILRVFRAKSPPRWLSCLLSLINTVERIKVTSERRDKMLQVTTNVWRWFDIATGKWNAYSAANNKIINDAYFRGEAKVKVSCGGRRRYVISFSDMIQTNEDTGNNRPVTMSLKCRSKMEGKNSSKEKQGENMDVDGSEYAELRKPVNLHKYEETKYRQIIKACVGLIKLQLDRSCLHASMYACLRFTRIHGLAKVFIEAGGIQALLALTYNGFNTGSLNVATLLIRHAVEEYAVLRHAMEKVIRTQAQLNDPTAYKEILFFMQQTSSCVCRCPKLYARIASEILRIDINLLSKRNEEEDQRLLIKCLPPKNVLPVIEDEYSVKVVVDLLNALAETYHDPYPEVRSFIDNQTRSTSMNEYGLNVGRVPQGWRRPILMRSAILKILADITKSYVAFAKVITDYVYSAGQTQLVKEECTALAFILDNFLMTKDAIDKECSMMARVLIVSLASTTHSADVQTTVISEIKAALARCVILPECPEKHLRIQQLSALISSIIYNCPGPSDTSRVHYSNNMNNIVKIMMRKGLVTDLAKITHSLDLTSFYLLTTMNSVLRTLEVVSRIVNIPIPPTCSKSGRVVRTFSTSDDQTSESRGRTSGSAHVEELVEAMDNSMPVTDNTSSEDMSLRADANREDSTEGNTRSSVSTRRPCTLEDAIVLNSGFDVEVEVEVEPHQRDGESNNPHPNSEAHTPYREPVGQTMHFENRGTAELDSDDSEDSEPSDTDVNNMDDDDDGEENEEGGSGYEEDNLEFLESEEDLFRIPGLDRESDDLLMIHYSDPNAAGSTSGPHVSWNSNPLPLTLGICDDPPNGNDSAGDIPASHPLIMARRNLAASGLTTSRTHRAIRQRHYQYLQMNPRSQNNAVILQRLLGSTAFELGIPVNPVAIAELPDSNIRVITSDRRIGVMSTSQSEEEGGEMDQPSYVFGPNLTATINNVPTPMYWWYEESKLLDTDSQVYAVLGTCHDVVKELEKYRAEDIAHRKEILKKKQEEANLRKKNLKKTENNGDMEVGTAASQTTRTPQNGSVPNEQTAAERYTRAIVQAVLQPQIPSDTNSTQDSHGTQGFDSAASTTQTTPTSSMNIFSSSSNSAELLAPLQSVIIENSNLSHAGSSFSAEMHDQVLNSHEEFADTEGQLVTFPDVASSQHVLSETSTDLTLPMHTENSDLADNCVTENQSQNSSSNDTNTQYGEQEAMEMERDSSEHEEDIPVQELMRHNTRSERMVALMPSTVLVTCTSSELTPASAAALIQATFPMRPQTGRRGASSGGPRITRSDSGNFLPPSLQISSSGISSGMRPLSSFRELSDTANAANDSTSREFHSQRIMLPLRRRPQSARRVLLLGDAESRGSHRETQRSRTSHSLDSPLNVDESSSSQGDGNNTTDEPSSIANTAPVDAIVSVTANTSSATVNTSVSSSAAFTATTDTVSSVSTAGVHSETADQSEVLEGVDPSFLAALPDDMREEVIAEQLRLQRLRQRTLQQTRELMAANVSEVNPEFLAALPPSIQEEVLAQHHLEQQRQAAVSSNPDDPVNAAEFFQNLPSSLRQTILTDMEESQISVLPPELAQEAQTLRREWEARNRQLMQDRFFSHVTHNNSALSSMLRNSGRVSAARYAIHSATGQSRAQWNTWSPSDGNGPHGSSYMRSGARALLDNEAITCLLVLLFVHDPMLNLGRLHRVLRNLCYHTPTREWILKTLLSILEKCCFSHKNALPEPKRMTTRSQSQSQGPPVVSTRGNWLNTCFTYSLARTTEVFLLLKYPTKRGLTYIGLQPEACPVVFRHTIDVLISMAKGLPVHFLLSLKSKEPEKVKDPNKEGTPKESQEAKCKASTSCGGTQNSRSAKSESAGFWDILLKLESMSTKKGKSVARPYLLHVSDEESSTPSIFDGSAFGRLFGLLSSSLIKRNKGLTDKLLKLLSHISVGLPEIVHTDMKHGDTKSAKEDLLPIAKYHMRLAVDVLTSQSCSEEGLEDITTLFLNLSNCFYPAKHVILNLLVDGAMELANMLKGHIGQVLGDLKVTNKILKRQHEEDAHNGEKPPKGTLTDRFTKDNVIINAPLKIKGKYDWSVTNVHLLTSKTSSQAFFLRTLKVIVQIRDSIKASNKKQKDSSRDAVATDTQTTVEESEKEVPQLSELLPLDDLWEVLSDCLTELAQTPDSHAVLILQPAVEAFFLVHSSVTEDKKTAQNNQETQGQVEQENPPPSEVGMIQPSVAPVSPLQSDSEGAATSHSASQPCVNWEAPAGTSSVPTEQQKFLQFAETHRMVLNEILRQSSTSIADGPFAVLVDHTRILDFDVKRRYFRSELERLDEGIRREELAVHVRRSQVFEDSFRELHRRTADEWKNRFYIVFEGEEGQDAGGLLREWYVIISREIFNPMYALFTTSPGDRVTYMINPSSHCNPNHLCYFKFVGRVIAKAIYDNKLLECYFTRSFYKHILGIPVKYTDMESEDYAFYQGLVYLMEHHVSDLGYDLTFSAEVQEFGVTDVRDLIPNGRNIAVCEKNKMDYIRLVCQMKMTGAIRKQIYAFLEGFYDIIPKRLISIFNEQELELLISGMPNVDIEDLKANTEYHKYSPTSLQIQWFWRALRDFDQANRAKFLQFVTGTSKVPLQGFAALEGMNGVQKFQIHRDDRSTDRLPSAHTCFNQLDLPVYETYDKLRTYLLKAIHECSEGFGFA